MATATRKHQHTAVRERGPYGYTAGVAVHPYTEENRAAHGSVSYVEECECGYERRSNSNGRDEEIGVWQKSEAMARREREEREHRRRIRAAERFLARGADLDVRGGLIRLDAAAGSDAEGLVSGHAVVLVSGAVAGGPRSATARELRRAARDWADAPGTPEADIYGAVAAALP